MNAGLEESPVSKELGERLGGSVEEKEAVVVAAPSGLTARQAAVWRFLTAVVGTEVTFTDQDPTGQEGSYRLKALGLSAAAVRKHPQLLTQNPRTLDEHWRYLTLHWPRLEEILRQTPIYLSHSLWGKHVLRASYLTVLEQRMQDSGKGPLPRFLDLSQVHAPLVISAGRFEDLLERLRWSPGTIDWGLFQTAWPVLVEMQLRVREGVSWDQDWAAVLQADNRLPKPVRELLELPKHESVRRGLFNERGRLQDSAYRIAFPLPGGSMYEGEAEWEEEEAAAGLEEKTLHYQHRSGANPALERISLEELGLGAPLPPITPLEAAVLKAFVIQRAHPLGSRLGASPNFKMRDLEGTLTHLEVATFLNFLWDLQRLIWKLDRETIRRKARRAFSEAVFLKEENPGPGRGLTEWGFDQSEESRWGDQFESLVNKALNQVETGFTPVGLHSFEGKSFQQVIPIIHGTTDSDLEIPLTLIPSEGITLRIGDQNFPFRMRPSWMEWAKAFLGWETPLWDRRWVIQDSSGKMVFQARGVQEVFQESGVAVRIQHSGLFGPEVPILQILDFSSPSEVFVERPETIPSTGLEEFGEWTPQRAKEFIQNLNQEYGGRISDLLDKELEHLRLTDNWAAIPLLEEWIGSPKSSRDFLVRLSKRWGAPLKSTLFFQRLHNKRLGLTRGDATVQAALAYWREVSNPRDQRWVVVLDLLSEGFSSLLTQNAEQKSRLSEWKISLGGLLKQFAEWEELYTALVQWDVRNRFKGKSGFVMLHGSSTRLFRPGIETVGKEFVLTWHLKTAKSWADTQLLVVRVPKERVITASWLDVTGERQINVSEGPVEILATLTPEQMERLNVPDFPFDVTVPDPRLWTYRGTQLPKWVRDLQKQQSGGLEEPDQVFHQSFPTLGLDVAGAREIGRRTVQQDAYQVVPLGKSGQEPVGLLTIVADGTGGLVGSELASQMAVEQIPPFLEIIAQRQGVSFLELLQQYRNLFLERERDSTQQFRSEDQIRGQIEEAVVEVSNRIGSSGLNIRTTVVLILFVGETAFIASVGDSRAYLYQFNKNRLILLTEDQTWAWEAARQQLKMDGEWESIPEWKYNLEISRRAKTQERRNQLLSSLGNLTKPPAVQSGVIRLEGNDRLVLTTDGITESVEDETIARVLSDGNLTVPEISRKLMALAKEGSDNRTVLVIDAKEISPTQAPEGGLEELVESSTSSIVVPVLDQPAVRQLFRSPEIRELQPSLVDAGIKIVDLLDPETAQITLLQEGGAGDLVVVTPQEPTLLGYLPTGVGIPILVMSAEVAAGLEEREWAALAEVAKAHGGILRVREITRSGLEEPLLTIQTAA